MKQTELRNIIQCKTKRLKIKKNKEFQIQFKQQPIQRLKIERLKDFCTLSNLT